MLHAKIAGFLCQVTAWSVKNAISAHSTCRQCTVTQVQNRTHCILCKRSSSLLTVNLLCAGTVIAAGKSLYLVPDVNAFRVRSSTPGGKQGLQVQGPLSASLSGGSVSLTDATGSTVDSASG